MKTSRKIDKSKKVIMLFLDGVGVGKRNPINNPFLNSKLPGLQSILEGNIPHLGLGFFKNSHAIYSGINATLGVKGLPQSGTGQTALLCGINAPKMIGKHFGPYPNSSLHKFIGEKNIFRQLDNLGVKSFYVNAYPPRYFEYVEKNKTRRTATTLAWTLSGNLLNDYVLLQRSEALSSDITGEKWNKLGFPKTKILTPQKAGKRLVDFLIKFDFVFYEYFYTDHAGHSQSMCNAVTELEKVDMLIQGILENLNVNEHSLIITSDHGNIENISVRTHTRNPVPLIIYGQMSNFFNKCIRNITQVAPAIVEFYKQ